MEANQRFEQRFRLYIIPIAIKGLGVFTRELIPQGAVVDICPGQRLSTEAINHIWRFKAEHLHWFVDDHDRFMYVVYGYGMVYNHDPQANLECDITYDSQGLAQAFTWTARREILPDEELTFDYNLTLPFKAVPNQDTIGELPRLRAGLKFLETEAVQIAEKTMAMKTRLAKLESRP
jgi:SET domain-containing protein